MLSVRESIGHRLPCGAWDDVSARGNDPRFIPLSRRTEGGKGGIMEGRYPQGLLLALTNCTDPSKEEEFGDVLV